MATNQAAILASKYGTRKAALDMSLMPEFLLDTAGAMRWDMPDLGTYEQQARLYARLSWIYSAVTIVGQTAALQMLNVKKRVGIELDDIDNHPFEMLLDKPNPLHSRFEFIVNSISYLGLNGNSFWWLNRTSEKQEPREMWIIPSHRILPVPDDKLYLKGYVYDPGPGYEPVLLPTWQIVHFKSFNPLNEFVGLSGIEPVGTSAETDIKSQEWSYRFYGNNNARLPGILAFKDQINNPLAWERIKDDVRQAAEMRNFLMLRGVGDKVDWLKAAATQEEMEYIAQRQFTKEEIYSIFAPGLASVLDVNATEANSKAGKQTFLEFAVWPRLVSMAQKITIDVLPAYGENLIAEFDDPRQVDRALELQEQEAYGKVHTIDEIRSEYYQDDKLGDERGDMLPAQVGQSTRMPGDEQNTPPQLMPFTGMEQQPPDEEPEVEEEPEEEEETPEEMKADLATWRRKALNALKAGKSAAVTFESHTIEPDLHATIWAQLSTCKSASQVREVFDKAMTKGSQQDGELLLELRRANDLLERYAPQAIETIN